jgi:hypothetical protein
MYRTDNIGFAVALRAHQRREILKPEAQQKVANSPPRLMGVKTQWPFEAQD